MALSGGELFVCDCEDHRIAVYDALTLTYKRGFGGYGEDGGELSFPYSCVVRARPDPIIFPPRRRARDYCGWLLRAATAGGGRGRRLRAAAAGGDCGWRLRVATAGGHGKWDALCT